MSIESQLTALAANKAAVKAAIEAKNPATAPTDALTQWPTSIASIPTGSSLDEIIAATTAMDGLSHTGATPSQLAVAILQVNRKSNRRGTDALASMTFTPDAGKTAFVVSVADDGARGLKFTIGGISRKSGSASVTIDWGDGTTTTTTTTADSPAQDTDLTHTYAAAGYYLVQISNDIVWWYPHLARVSGSNFNSYDGMLPQGSWSDAIYDGQTGGHWHCMNLLKVVRNIQWGAAVNNAEYTFAGCRALTGPVPAWGSAITTANGCYRSCQGLTGAPPAWGTSITNASYTYSECYGLTGAVPPWGSAITNADHTFFLCYGLTGAVPPWSSAITNAVQTFEGCSGLTGTIPAWGSSIASAYATYRNCTGLSGSVPTWGSAITTAQSTYERCYGLTGAPPPWTNSITNANSTFLYCSGLKGAMPEWGTAITNANNCFQFCVGLTGPWSTSATDAELMPSHITSHTSVVLYCNPALRNYFLTTWGGTRSA